jgi:hypothetical protein
MHFLPVAAAFKKLDAGAQVEREIGAAGAQSRDE